VTQQQFSNPFGQPAQAPPAAPANPFGAAAPQTPQQYPPNVAGSFSAPTAPGIGSTAAPAQPFGEDPFGAPAPRQARAPRLLDLHTSYPGRLILLAPIKVEVVPNRNEGAPPGSTQDRMTMDIVVLDGPPIPYGGKPEARIPTPHTQQVSVPVLFENVYNSNSALVSQCREALLARQTGGSRWMVLGRLGIGEQRDPTGQKQPPWVIVPTEEQADHELARRFLASELAVPMLSKPRGTGR
jgi:hypothetical protein